MKLFNCSIFILLFIVIHTVSGQSLNYRSPHLPWSAEIGLGPSFLLADNSFISGETTFKPMFGLSGSLTKNFSNRYSIRGTLGYQRVSGEAQVSMDELIELGNQNLAYSVIGNSLYADISPVIKYARRTFYENRTHINLYSSLGIGAMILNADHATMLNDQSLITGYNDIFLIIPFRTGITYRFQPLWEFSLEGTFMVTFNDNIDGRSIDNNLNDYFGNIQIKVRRTFSIYEN